MFSAGACVLSRPPPPRAPPTPPRLSTPPWLLLLASARAVLRIPAAAAEAGRSGAEGRSGRRGFCLAQVLARGSAWRASRGERASGNGREQLAPCTPRESLGEAASHEEMAAACDERKREVI